jgi:hypothetical protein
MIEIKLCEDEALHLGELFTLAFELSPRMIDSIEDHYTREVVGRIALEADKAGTGWLGLLPEYNEDSE